MVDPLPCPLGDLMRQPGRIQYPLNGEINGKGRAEEDSFHTKVDHQMVSSGQRAVWRPEPVPGRSQGRVAIRQWPVHYGVLGSTCHSVCLAHSTCSCNINCY